MIKDMNELKSFIERQQLECTQNESGISWKINGERLCFIRAAKEVGEIPSISMIGVSLDYATELNRII